MPKDRLKESKENGDIRIWTVTARKSSHVVRDLQSSEGVGMQLPGLFAEEPEGGRGSMLWTAYPNCSRTSWALGMPLLLTPLMPRSWSHARSLVGGGVMEGSRI